MSFGIYEYGQDYVMYFTGNIVMVAMFTYFMLGVRFTIAVLDTAISSISGIVTLSFISIDLDNYVYAVQLTATSCGILTIGAYGNERHARLAYIRAKQLLSSERKRYEEEKTRINWLENMASFLRHELRNTVTGVKTSLELLKRKHDIQENDKYLARSGNGISRIGSLLDSVGDATSIESSFIKEKLSAVDISRVVADTIEQYEQLYPDNNFVFKTNHNGMTIFGKEDRIVQILDNLVNNAVDHAKDDSDILISLYANDKICQLSVANEGVPLPADKESIFDLFASFRKDNSGEIKRGMGLYIVRLIVEHYGGRVEAQDHQAEGAEFIITLPLMKSR